MKILVCGGRTYDDAEKVDEILSPYLVEDDLYIIEGGARGADTLAFIWAANHDVVCVTVEANWSKYKKAAGHIRNSWMLELNPDLVVVFPGGKGTANMVEQAREKGVDVIEVLADDTDLGS